MAVPIEVAKKLSKTSTGRSLLEARRKAEQNQKKTTTNKVTESKFFKNLPPKAQETVKRIITVSSKKSTPKKTSKKKTTVTPTETTVSAPPDSDITKTPFFQSLPESAQKTVSKAVTGKAYSAPPKVSYKGVDITAVPKPVRKEIVTQDYTAEAAKEQVQMYTTESAPEPEYKDLTEKEVQMLNIGSKTLGKLFPEVYLKTRQINVPYLPSDLNATEIELVKKGKYGTAIEKYEDRKEAAANVIATKMKGQYEYTVGDKETIGQIEKLYNAYQNATGPYKKELFGALTSALQQADEAIFYTNQPGISTDNTILDESTLTAARKAYRDNSATGSLTKLQWENLTKFRNQYETYISNIKNAPPGTSWNYDGKQYTYNERNQLISKLKEILDNIKIVMPTVSGAKTYIPGEISFDDFKTDAGENYTQSVISQLEKPSDVTNQQWSNIVSSFRAGKIDVSGVNQKIINIKLSNIEIPQIYRDLGMTNYYKDQIKKGMLGQATSDDIKKALDRKLIEEMQNSSLSEQRRIESNYPALVNPSLTQKVEDYKKVYESALTKSKGGYLAYRLSGFGTKNLFTRDDYSKWIKENPKPSKFEQNLIESYKSKGNYLVSLDKYKQMTHERALEYEWNKSATKLEDIIKPTMNYERVEKEEWKELGEKSIFGGEITPVEKAIQITSGITPTQAAKILVVGVTQFPRTVYAGIVAAGQTIAETIQDPRKNLILPITFDAKFKKYAQPELYKGGYGISQAARAGHRTGDWGQYVGHIAQTPAMTDVVYPFALGAGFGAVFAKVGQLGASTGAKFVTTATGRTVVRGGTLAGRTALRIPQYGGKIMLGAASGAVGAEIGLTAFEEYKRTGSHWQAWTSPTTWKLISQRGLQFGMAGLGAKVGTEYIGFTPSVQKEVPDPYGFKKLSPTESKTLYRQLSMKYHPDRPTGNRMLFEQVKASYEAYGREPSISIFGSKKGVSLKTRFSSEAAKIRSKMWTIKGKPSIPKGKALTLWKQQAKYDFDFTAPLFTPKPTIRPTQPGGELVEVRGVKVIKPTGTTPSTFKPPKTLALGKEALPPGQYPDIGRKPTFLSATERYQPKTFKFASAEAARQAQIEFQEQIKQSIKTQRKLSRLPTADKTTEVSRPAKVGELKSRIFGQESALGAISQKLKLPKIFQPKPQRTIYRPELEKVPATEIPGKALEKGIGRMSRYRTKTEELHIIRDKYGKIKGVEPKQEIKYPYIEEEPKISKSFIKESGKIDASLKRYIKSKNIKVMSPEEAIIKYYNPTEPYWRDAYNINFKAVEQYQKMPKGTAKTREYKKLLKEIKNQIYDEKTGGYKIAGTTTGGEYPGPMTPIPNDVVIISSKVPKTKISALLKDIITKKGITKFKNMPYGKGKGYLLRKDIIKGEVLHEAYRKPQKLYDMQKRLIKLSNEMQLEYVKQYKGKPNKFKQIESKYNKLYDKFAKTRLDYEKRIHEELQPMKKPFTLKQKAFMKRLTTKRTITEAREDFMDKKLPVKAKGFTITEITNPKILKQRIKPAKLKRMVEKYMKRHPGTSYDVAESEVLKIAGTEIRKTAKIQLTRAGGKPTDRNKSLSEIARMYRESFALEMSTEPLDIPQPYNIERPPGYMATGKYAPKSRALTRGERSIDFRIKDTEPLAYGKQKTISDIVSTYKAKLKPATELKQKRTTLRNKLKDEFTMKALERYQQMHEGDITKQISYTPKGEPTFLPKGVDQSVTSIKITDILFDKDINQVSVTAQENLLQRIRNPATQEYDYVRLYLHNYKIIPEIPKNEAITRTIEEWIKGKAIGTGTKLSPKQIEVLNKPVKELTILGRKFSFKYGNIKLKDVPITLRPGQTFDIGIGTGQLQDVPMGEPFDVVTFGKTKNVKIDPEWLQKKGALSKTEAEEVIMASLDEQAGLKPAPSLYRERFIQVRKEITDTEKLKKYFEPERKRIPTAKEIIERQGRITLGEEPKPSEYIEQPFRFKGLEGLEKPMYYKGTAKIERIPEGIKPLKTEIKTPSETKTEAYAKLVEGPQYKEGQMIRRDWYAEMYGTTKGRGFRRTYTLSKIKDLTVGKGDLGTDALKFKLHLKRLMGTQSPKTLTAEQLAKVKTPQKLKLTKAQKRLIAKEVIAKSRTAQTQQAALRAQDIKSRGMEKMLMTGKKGLSQYKFTKTKQDRIKLQYKPTKKTAVPESIKAEKEIGEYITKTGEKRIAKATYKITGMSKKEFDAAYRKAMKELQEEHRVAKEIEKIISRQEGKQISKQTTRNISREVTKEVSKEVSKDIEKQIQRPLTRQVNKQIERQIERQVQRQLQRQLQRQIQRQLPRQVTKEIPKFIPMITPFEPEPIPEPVPEPIIEPEVKPKPPTTGFGFPYLPKEKEKEKKKRPKKRKLPKDYKWRHFKTPTFAGTLRKKPPMYDYKPKKSKMYDYKQQHNKIYKPKKFKM